MGKKTETLAERIMVNGRFPHPHNDCLFIEIQRGMSVKTCTGEEAGFSAGILVDRCNNITTHILLGRLPDPVEYRLIPVNHIDHVTNSEIHLNIDKVAVEKLSIHQPTW